MKIKDKVTLIVGATSMIGQACAHLFAQEGRKLMLAARNEHELNKLAKELPGEVGYCVADICIEESVKSIISKTLKTFHRIDAVILNVAIYPWRQINELDLAEWNQTLNTNLTGPFLITQACFSVMKKQQAGNIIFISSIAGEIIGLPYMAAYAASKAGINGFMRTAALEFAPYNINVNSISPGKVYDPNQLSDDEQKIKIAPIPLQRFIEPQDIANMALFLLSDKAKNITGQNFIIDGGQSIIGENAHIQKMI